MDKWKQRREYVSEAFHALNQPLTALHCVIELALLQPRSGEEYRMRLRESLQLVDRIFELTAGVRELVEADDPGARGEFLISKVLQEVKEKYCASADRGIELKLPRDAMVVADFDRLCKALARLLEQFYADGIPAVEILTAASADQREIAIMIRGGEVRTVHDNRKPGVDEKLRRLRLTTAMLALEAGGGRLDHVAPDSAQVLVPVARWIPESECIPTAATMVKDLHPYPVRTGP